MAASIENSARIRRHHALIALCLLSAAAIAGAADRLAGSKWLVEDVGGRGVIDNLQMTLEFSDDGRVSCRLQHLARAS